MEHLGLNCADIKSWQEVKFQEDWNRERRHDVLHVLNTQSVTRNKSIFDLSIEKRCFCLFSLMMDEIIILVGKKLKINMRGATNLLCASKGMTIIVDCNYHSVN